MTEYRKVQMNIWKLEIYAFTKSTIEIYVSGEQKELFQYCNTWILLLMMQHSRKNIFGAESV